MEKRILAAIKQGRVLVSDGAWGTFIQARGLKPGECPELWNLTHPADIYDIALSYIHAGSDMIETNSFGGNIFKLSNYGLSGKVAEINRRAAEISREAAGPDRFVLGSAGPTGKILMTGDVTENELYDAFAEQSMALHEGGADAIVIETMIDLDEALIAVKAAKENTDCEIICTFTFDLTPLKEFRTMMGVAPANIVDALVNAGADIIGTNCGNGIVGMINIVKEIRSVNNTVPILVHANAGIPVLKNGISVFPETPELMARYANELVDAGTNIIGGCCGTTPEHIRQIADKVRSF
jgi:5-methyltetrahydrofolate--homocysteine methyltransferase